MVELSLNLRQIQYSWQEQYVEWLIMIEAARKALSFNHDCCLGGCGSDSANHLGDSEWQDLEAAARYALAQGAQHLVLYGWSQGGAVVEVFMHHSSLAHVVQALVLDAPILDWPATLAYQAQRMSVPRFLANTAELVTSIRSGINFNDLDQTNQPQLTVPILLFHGTDDSSTPVLISNAFASAHPDLVTYVRVSAVEHTEAWNANPQVYDNELTAFLKQKLSVQTS